MVTKRGTVWLLIAVGGGLIDSLYHEAYLASILLIGLLWIAGTVYNEDAV